MDDYKKNKIIFNKIIGKKYKIKKDLNERNILYIITNNNKIKCKYVMFLIEKPINNTNDKIKKSIIIWSDSNPYIDIYTQELSNIIRNKLLTNNNNLINQNNQIIFKNDLDNLIKDLISNQYIFQDKYNNNIYCQWIITNNNNSNNIEYFMITEIIYL